MPNYVSPGVFVIEKDISQYAPTVNSSVVGVVGFASKGPVNKATLITSPQQLIDTFGEPREALAGQGLEGSLEILEQTNSLYYVRASNSDAANASSTIAFGGCPAVQVCAMEFGTTAPIFIHAQVTNNVGTSKYLSTKIFSIPANTSTGSTRSQGKALQKVIGGSLDSDKIGVYFDAGTSNTAYIVGAFAGSGSTLSLSAYSQPNGTTLVGDALTNGSYILTGVHGCFNQLDASGYTSGASFGSGIAYGTTINSTDVASSLTYQIQSLHPGDGYNAGTKANGNTSGNSIEISSLGGPYSKVTVNENGVTKETFKVSLVLNKDFVEDKINTSFTTDLTSDTIQGSLFFSGADAASPVALSSFIDNVSGLGHSRIGIQGFHGGATSVQHVAPRFAKMLEGSHNMTGGDNAISSTAAGKDTDLIGDATVTPKTGMQALDDEVLNISLAIVPGITSQNTQNALITLAESTQAFLAIISPPYGVGTPQNAIDWTNGQSDTRTASVASNYAAIYWPWVQTFSVHDGKDRWYDPAIFGVRQMVHTDSVSEPWFAPAGFVRGRLTKPSDVEVKLNQGDRDSMYSGGNILNPIVNFVRQGITIFGQRTAQRNPTALDRINVRRLLIQIRKVILAATRQFVFEPNDEFTWNQIEGILNPFLDDIKRRRGIVEFRVVCDATTNTPARVDRNELWCKVLIKPTKTAEIIIFEVNLTNQSAQLGGE